MAWISEKQKSPHFNSRPESVEVSLLVIHNISLPAGEFGTPFVHDLFMGNIDCTAHDTFTSLEGLKVSAHFFVKRCGSVTQYVDTKDRAWHAGVSSFNGVSNCNDFSIGIELEGTDAIPYSNLQYEALAKLTKQLMYLYPRIVKSRIVGHCDIAPGRKSDPGAAFDWQLYFKLIDVIE